MVLSAKIFKIREEVDLITISEKLKGFRKEEEIEEGKLITEIENLKLGTDYIEGLFSQDIPITFYHREGEKTIIKTIEAPFLFQIYNDKIFLVIIEKKRLANNIANQLSKILFINIGSIIEAEIPSETLRSFHEANPEDTKVIFFDNVDIPNIEKLSLYGSQLLNTNLYNEYLSHGNIWYIVFKSKKFGIIVGITRDCVITCFSKIEPKEFLNYIKEEVFPLIK
jgi:hypothetical protein